MSSHTHTPCSWNLPHVDKCTPLCVIHTRHMRGLSDFISGDAIEVRSLEPVLCVPYNRLEYTRTCFFCCFIIVINGQPQLQKCEYKLNPLLSYSKAELNVNREYTYLQIAWPQICWDVWSVACCWHQNLASLPWTWKSQLMMSKAEKSRN
jgi:hypothetical protein